MPTEHIKYTDNLRQGTDKLNTAIDAANAAETLMDTGILIIQEKTDEAVAIATDAAANADDKATMANQAATDANAAVTVVNDLVERVEGWEFLGEYNPTAAYVKNNSVRFNGASYIAILDTAGNMPTNLTYWSLIAQRGVDGTGAVASVEGNSPDVNGDVKIPAMATKQELQVIKDDAAMHRAESAMVTKSKRHISTSSSVVKPLITFIDDDGRDECFTYLKPLMDAKGFRACSAIISDSVGKTDYMSLGQIKGLRDSGWEIMSHSKTHPRLGDMSADMSYEELIDSYDYLKDNGIEVDGFVYPYGNQNAAVRTQTKEIYDYAFAGWGQNATPLQTTFIKRIVLGEDENLTLNNFKYRVDEAIQNKYWLVFCFHIAATSLAQRQILSELLDYIATKSGEVEVVTAREAINTFGNVYDSWNEETGEHFLIGSDNKQYASKPIINSLPLPADFTSGYIRYEKGANNLVLININLTKTANFSANSSIILGSMPVGFRPMFQPAPQKSFASDNGGSMVTSDIWAVLADGINIKLLATPTHTGNARNVITQLMYYAKPGE